MFTRLARLLGSCWTCFLPWPLDLGLDWDWDKVRDRRHSGQGPCAFLPVDFERNCGSALQPQCLALICTAVIGCTTRT